MPRTTSKPTKREAELVAEITAMKKLAKAAEGKNYSAAVQALAKVSALKTELHRLREEREAESETDPLKRVQRLRRLTTEAGSYTAAANLLQQETELLAAREAAAAATLGDGLDVASEADVLAVIEAAIISLPDPLVMRVRDAAQARLDGQRLRLVGSK